MIGPRPTMAAATNRCRTPAGCRPAAPKPPAVVPPLRQAQAGRQAEEAHERARVRERAQPHVQVLARALLLPPLPLPLPRLPPLRLRAQRRRQQTGRAPLPPPRRRAGPAQQWRQRVHAPSPWRPLTCPAWSSLLQQAGRQLAGHQAAQCSTLLPPTLSQLEAHHGAPHSLPPVSLSVVCGHVAWDQSWNHARRPRQGGTLGLTLSSRQACRLPTRYQRATLLQQLLPCRQGHPLLYVRQRAPRHPRLALPSCRPQFYGLAARQMLLPRSWPRRQLQIRHQRGLAPALQQHRLVPLSPLLPAPAQT